MHAVGADAEEGDGAAVELEQRRLAPARRHGEILIAPFVDAALGDERVDDAVDRRAELDEPAIRDQRDIVLRDREDGGKAAQRRGIVMPDPADAGAAEAERPKIRRPVAVARLDVVDEAHAAGSNQISK